MQSLGEYWFMKFGFYVGALEKPVEAALEHLDGLGIDGVDLPGDLTLDWKKVGELLRSYNFKVPELSGQFDRFQLTDPDESRRNAAISYGEGLIELAASLGTACETSFFTNWANLKNYGLEALLEKGRDSLSRLCKRAKDVGVRVIIEPINRFELLPDVAVVNKTSQVLEMIEGISEDNVWVLCDTWNFSLEERSLYEGVRACGGRIGHVHLADSNRGLPGSGSIDFKEFLRQLKGTGYGGYMSLEPRPVPTREEVSDSLRYLKSLEPYI